jgi:mycofactocin system creatininase family protein
LSAVPRLADATWSEVAIGGAAHLVVPLGSCEQHGPHLPLDVDTRIAEAVARRLVDRRDDLTLGPTISIGASGEHAGFAGTLSIGREALELVLVELARSADHFSSVVVVNGHGGNVDALVRAARVLESDGRRFCHLDCHVPGSDPHAGWGETSILLHLAPEVVRMELAEIGLMKPWSEIGDRVVIEGFAAVSPNGVLGDPTRATAVDGERLLAELVDRLSLKMAGWADD